MISQTSTIQNVKPIKSSLWTSKIPRINMISFVIYVILLLFVDLSIVITSPSLLEYFYMMLFVFGTFMVFFILENALLCRKFTDYQDIDYVILVLIVVRNLIYLLNFIPLIQLVGILIAYTFGIVIVILYITLIVLRYLRNHKKPTNLTLQ